LVQNAQDWFSTVQGPPYSQPPLTPSLHGTTFFPPSPSSSYNSSDRFARLAMLKYSGQLSNWK